MADDKAPHEDKPEEDKPEDKTPEATAEQAADEMIEAEGPDVETSFTDDDLAFLAGDSTPAGEMDPTVEMLGDLKRVQAEFANYRKRVERDREATRELNIAEVVKALLPVLDDLALAEAHGDLAEGPMMVIAQKLSSSLDKFGLVRIGEKGEPFDPNVHEALVQLPSPDVTVNTVADVVAPGYKLGERLLRPAKVAVSVPAE